MLLSEYAGSYNDCSIRVFCRFHDKSDEPSLDHSIIPLLNDNVQLTVEEYRDNLYEVCVCVFQSCR